MKRISNFTIVIIFLIVYNNLNAQKIGWEVRTNNKEYLKASIKD